MKRAKTIRYLYLLYPVFGLIYLAVALVRLILFLFTPAYPPGVSIDAYRFLFFTSRSIEILIASAFLDYGVYGTLHQEGRTKASYYVPLWFMGIGDALLFILSGIGISLLRTPEATDEGITSLLYAHFCDPVYLFSFVGAILLIRAFQREDRGGHYLKEGYIGLAFFFPLYVYDLTLFALDIINSLASVSAIIFGTFFYLFRLVLWILAFFALSETDE